ncbi:MAG: exodeoxyribonuclease I [Rubrivivax sp.]|nr:exodeoxyribonuclease I [Rubrivivax sp.]
MPAPFSFFWHDYETFGRTPRRDRPAQFAGLRTDAELNEIDAPVMLHCQPPTDSLPDPQSCLLTGIVPQHCLAQGVPEHQFAAQIEQQLGRPGTVGVGYNSIRFDDEVTRFLFWRNLIDPYAREWQNECGRWDLMDTVRCAYALRPDGIQWPREEGKPSFRLEKLTQANGLQHEAAHDALSDVRATLALARLVRARVPRLWDFCLKLRQKSAVQAELVLGRPVLHISGMIPAERGCLAIVWPFAPHPTNKNEVIVWDLAQDPAQLMALSTPQLRERLFTSREGLAALGLERLPLKTIHINKSPVVISQLQTLTPVMAERWGVDRALCDRHAQTAARITGEMAGVWPGVFAREGPAETPDVDEDLYGGFVGNEDRRLLQRLRDLPPAQLALQRPRFADGRLDELLLRYRARNFPETLNAEEQQHWQAHRHARLHEGVNGHPPLAAWMDRIDQLNEVAELQGDERAQQLLSWLVDWAEQVAPET